VNPKYCKQKSTIACLLCDKLVTHDLGKLKVHFMKTHPEMTLEDYFKRFVTVAAGTTKTADPKPIHMPITAVKRERGDSEFSSGSSISSISNAFPSTSVCEVILDDSGKMINSIDCLLSPGRFT
jgi:hypothetical protein